MKEHDIARALTEVSDDLLLEAENAGATRKTIKFHRLIAVAAIIAMLAVTVGAVSAGITRSLSRESAEDVAEKYGGLAWEYYKDYDGSQDFEKLELALPLGVVKLPEQNLEKIRALTQRLDDSDPSEEVDFYVQNHMGHYSIPEDPFVSLWSLTDVENLLGITLDIPDPLRKAMQLGSESDNTWVWVRIYARAAETGGAPEPAKVEISFQLTGYATNGGVSGSITVPLTEEAAQEGMHVLHYSYESEGAIWQEEQIVGGYAVTIFGNDPEEGFDASAGAVYTSGGIGYCISARRDADIPCYSPSWPYYDSAKDMVLSLLANGE